MKSALIKTFIFLMIFTLFSWACIILSFRVLLPSVEANKPLVENWLSEQIGVDVTINNLNTAWINHHPALTFKSLTFKTPNSDEVITKVGHGLISLDIFASLTAFQPMFDVIRFNGIHLKVNQNESGGFDIQGMSTTQSSEPEETTTAQLHQVAEWLLSQNEISIEDVALEVTRKNGAELPLFVRHVTLKHENDQHLLQSKMFAAYSTTTAIDLQFDWSGELFSETSPSVNWYLSATDMVLEEWYPERHFSNLELVKGNLDLSLWGTYRGGQSKAFKGKLSLTDAIIHSAINKTSHTIPQLDLAIGLEAHSATQWSATIEQQLLQLEDRIWPTSRAQVQFNPKSPSSEFKLFADYIDVAVVQHLADAFGDSDVQAMVSTLRPSGAFKDVFIEKNTDTHLTIMSRLEGFDNRGTPKIPSLSGLDASLWLAGDSGSLVLDAADTQAYFPSVQVRPITFDVLTGLIHFKATSDGWVLTSPYLLAETEFFTLDTTFDLHLGERTNLKATGKLDNFLAGEFRQFMPERIMSQKLRTWLKTSIKSIKADDTRFLVHGTLEDFPYHNKSGRFEISTALSELSVDYADEWPQIESTSGILLFDGPSVQLSIDGGQIGGFDIQPTVAKIDDLEINDLVIDANVHGTSEVALAFLRTGPLRENVGQHLDSITINGPIHTKMTLMIPLDRDAEETVDGTVTFLDNTLTVANQFEFLKLSGDFHFTDVLFDANNLSAELYGEPATIDIESWEENNSLRVKNTLNGKLPFRTFLNKLLDSPTDRWSRSISGTAPYQAIVDLYTDTRAGDAPVVINISTELEGVNVDTPEPFFKLPLQKRPLKARVDVFPAEDRFTTYIDYGKRIYSKLNWLSTEEATQFQQGLVFFGKSLSGKLPKNGLRFSGAVNQLDLDTWLDFINRPIEPSSKPSGPPIMERISLQTGELKLIGQTFSSVPVTIEPKASNWYLTFKGKQIDGEIIFPESKKAPIDVSFKTLSINSKDRKTSKTLRPVDVPNFNFSVAAFQYNDIMLENFGFKVVKNSVDSLNVNNLRFETQHAALDAELSWTGRSKFKTIFNGELKAKSVDGLFSSFGIESGLKDSSGEFVFDLNWEDSPLKFKLEEVVGDFNIDIDEGRLVEVNPGATRLIGLLTLSSLKRRLTLDFSDLYSEGLSYDSITGHVRLVNGNAYTCNTKLLGPSARIELQGRTGLISKDLQQIAAVSLKVTDSVPYIVAAINPIAGAITWVGNQLLADEISDITAVLYEINGPWSDPKIEPISAPKAFTPWEVLPDIIQPFKGDETKSGVSYSPFCSD